jgi:hypothetical protein
MAFVPRGKIGEVPAIFLKPLDRRFEGSPWTRGNSRRGAENGFGARIASLGCGPCPDFVHSNGAIWWIAWGTLASRIVTNSHVSLQNHLGGTTVPLARTTGTVRVSMPEREQFLLRRINTCAEPPDVQT